MATPLPVPEAVPHAEAQLPRTSEMTVVVDADAQQQDESSAPALAPVAAQSSPRGREPLDVVPLAAGFGVGFGGVGNNLFDYHCQQHPNNTRESTRSRQSNISVPSPGPTSLYSFTLKPQDSLEGDAFSLGPRSRMSTASYRYSTRICLLESPVSCVYLTISCQIL